jgi:L-alanine-DL-glutamate epimerase-like enolase superfamily enzyme
LPPLSISLSPGEYTYNHQGIFELLELKAADILMPDLQRMVGPTEFLRAAAICEAFDIPVSSHVFPEMSLALMACVPNASYHEYISWFDALYRSCGRRWQSRPRSAGIVAARAA